MSSNIKFPPEAQIPYSARKDQLLTCMFLAIRKATTDQYKNPDGTPLMGYHETLGDRDQIRSKVLDYELAQGWITDDRSVAQVIPHPAVQNGASVATNGTPPNGAQAPVPQPVPVAQPAIGFQQTQQVASPVQAIAAAQQQMTSPPQQMAPPAAPTTGFKRPAPKLATAVAPPPPPAPTVVAPQPPPGAQVLSAPQPTQTTVAQPAMMAPVALAAPVPVAQAPAPQVPIAIDLGSIVSRVDELGKGLTLISDEIDKQKTDFKTFVGNLSGQASETNKALSELSKQLAEMKKTQDLVLTAVHHIYLSTGQLGQAAGQDGTTIPGFKSFLGKYLPQ